MHRECRQQVLIEAPVELVWDLVSDPNRHAEWWPTVVDTECEDLHEGCRFRSVVKSPWGTKQEHDFTVERLEACREVVIRCNIGTYTRFVLTGAQGSTFVDAEFGMDPDTLRMQAIGLVAGRRVLRRWLQESVEALERAARTRARAGAEAA